MCVPLLENGEREKERERKKKRSIKICEEKKERKERMIFRGRRGAGG